MPRPLVVGNIRALVFGAAFRVDEDRLSATVETWDDAAPGRPAAAWAVLFSSHGTEDAVHIGGAKAPNPEEQQAAIFAAALDIARRATARKL